MARMEPLLTLTVTHDYFERLSDPIFKVESRMDYRKQLGGPRFPFIHRSPDTWSVIGDQNQLSEMLAQSPDGEVLEIEFTITDPNFLSYTPAYLPDKTGDDSIRFIQDSPGMSRMKVQIRITESMLRSACPIEKCIHYTSLERHWKFLFIPRNPDQTFGEISLEDARGTLSFNKVEPAQFMGKNIFKITSSQPIKLKDQRYSRNGPELSLYETREYGKRLLQRHIPAPEPGRFLIKEEQPNKEILQILYI